MSNKLITVGEAAQRLGASSDLPSNKCITKDEFDNLVSQIPGGTYGYLNINLLSYEEYRPTHSEGYVSLLLSDLKQNTYLLAYFDVGEFDSSAISNCIIVNYELYNAIISLQDGQETTYHNNTFRRVSDRFVIIDWDSYNLGTPVVIRINTPYT